MATKLKFELSDMARRVLGTNDALAFELIQRGILPKRELQALVKTPKWNRMSRTPRLRNSLFAAELANADRQLAARAVLHGLLSGEELAALDAMLRFQPRGKHAGKLDELIRIVERNLEG